MTQLKSIMLVDDNEIDRLLVERVIEVYRLCKKVVTTKHGIDALQKLEEYHVACGDLPDVILIDLRMPIMDGFELIRTIRELPYYSQSKTKLIVLTASLDEMDIEKLKSMKVYHWLLKPLDKDEFLKCLK